MADDPATNVLKVQSISANNNDSNSYILNEAVQPLNPDVNLSMNDKKNSEIKKCKCFCITCRECCCCTFGGILSIIIGVAAFLIFILISAKTVKPDTIGKPSKIIFNISNPSIGSDYIYLKWIKPKITGGSYIISYTLQYKIHSNNNNNFTEIFMIDNGLQCNHNVTNLKGSVMYDFRITSNNLAGFTGNWSKIYSVKTKPPTIPQPPSSPFPMNITQTKDLIQFTLGFEASSDGGSPITLYQIYYGLNSNNTIYKQFCNITQASIALLNEYNYPNCTGNLTLSELSLLYNFKVQSTNLIGNSSFSLFTPCIIPQQDIYLYMCSIVYPPSIINNSSFTLTVSSYEIDIKWEPPECKQYSPILSYQLQQTDWWNNKPLTNQTIPNNGLSLYAQLNGLLAGITYNIRIRAINKYGGGFWSNLEITTAEIGSCGNYYDTNILKMNCKTFPTKMPQIWLNCDGKDSCQTKEIQQDFGFSDECTVCWVQLNDCIMGTCFQECMHETPTKCENCIMQKCSDQTETCTGYPEWPMTCPTS